MFFENPGFVFSKMGVCFLKTRGFFLKWVCFLKWEFFRRWDFAFSNFMFFRI